METKLKIGDKFTQSDVLDGIIHKVVKIIISADSIRYASDYGVGVTFKESEVQKYEEPKPKKLYAIQDMHGLIAFTDNLDLHMRDGCKFSPEYDIDYDKILSKR